ncbi:hypothetical protein B0T19DRAFT_431940 [Cercophora scortea]|uniref:Uncharacterized protein n=1 Tax=Cercophora scortea TaxID=314031 RepID=A0AAE0I9X0_9PEZI|nr:hypothetical protein B0T19DRAFT_431940 [Cercophora scortea]
MIKAMGPCPGAEATADAHVGAAVDSGHRTVTASSCYTDTHSPLATNTTLGSCTCLHRAVVLLSELESRSAIIDGGDSLSNTIPAMSVDSLLTTHKETVGHGTTMLDCAACRARVENMTILAFLADKLAQLWRRTIVSDMLVLSVGNNEMTTAVGTPSGLVSVNNLNVGANTGTKYSETTPMNPSESPTGLAPRPTPTCTPLLPLTLGTYTASASDECAEVVRALVAFQLRRLHLLAHRLRQIAAQLGGSDTMERRVTACERTLIWAMGALHVDN